MVKRLPDYMVSSRRGKDAVLLALTLGHSSLQMIYTKYYSWMKNETRADGSAFMRNFYGRIVGSKTSAVKVMRADFTPNLRQVKERAHSNKL